MKKTAALLVALAAAAPLRALAGSPSLGITLNAANGVHTESGGTANVPMLAVPVGEVRVPLGRFELRGEWLPPIGPIRFTGSPLNIHTTRIGYASGIVYFRLPDSQLRIGLGETLFNQQTLYSSSSTSGSSRQQIDTTLSSRVGGLRVAVMQSWALGSRLNLIAEAAASPSMHAPLDGTQTVSNYVAGALVSAGSVNANTSETASLVDAELYAEQRSGRTAFNYGVRYINYASVYDRTGRLADRNRLLTGFVGLRRFFR